MSQLTYLMREICAGVEIFYSSKTGGHFCKTAFILGDNYTELVSKLFLLEYNPRWSERKDKNIKKFQKVKDRVNDALDNKNNPDLEDIRQLVDGAKKDGLKNYIEILGDVRNVLKEQNIQTPKLSLFENLCKKMEQRRKLRNNFFHSAQLLSLSVSNRECVEAFCDLLDYGELLFKSKWEKERSAERTLDSLEILLRLDRKCYSNNALREKVDEIFKKCPRYKRRNKTYISKKGFQITQYPEDLHLILSILDGGQELRDKLVALLP